jgi:hypothetical protein
MNSNSLPNHTSGSGVNFIEKGKEMREFEGNHEKYL